ncbi:hypothetical protein [Pedobacter sp. MR2016-24]|uniref:hypothetical protein n=1 Tax=Pedobacter sp. MR2016-24 TaxID=2994466 RepID=UPI002246CF54|nr:hypothetical protein [Pedobacter sp. MR2016-24]MCX2482560.1 hypothetical protein [Pedobacter sp. MR2016-24]
MMNQEDIFKKIGQILNELGEQYQYLAQNPQELNELELELFLANADFLSDHVQIIKKINTKTARKILPEHTEINEETVVPPLDIISTAVQEETLPVKPVHDQDIFRIDQEPSTFEFILSEGSDTDKFEFEEKSVDEIFDRPLSKEEEEIIARKQKLKEKEEFELQSPAPEEDEIGPEPFLVADSVEEIEPELVEEPEPQITAEEEILPEPVQETIITPEPGSASTFTAPAVSMPESVEIPEPEPVVQQQLFTPSSPVVPPVVERQSEDKPAGKPTLNDILAGNNTRTAQNGAGRAPITDLKHAINLNDKMRYIKDLFNGYNLAYAEAIDLLNKMPDFRTADAFLQNNYAVKNNWAAKQETADQFYELLHQRFPAK